ncbi:hypothetical protein IWZ00DRAFT_545117 [Phyllosticta capitalensis]|uniref:uncharacterized protein n=1 Tax=Phyllosticta capitalensis TaxID=121624 RepID=UPI0031317DE3
MPPPFSISSIFKPGSCHSSEMGNMSKQRQTALALVDAMNRCDTRTVFELRERNAPREIYPRALGSKVQDDDGVRNTLNLFRNVFKSLDLVVHEIIEDIPNRKVCMWIYADGVTVTGRYTNEHVWNLHFNETGTKITRWMDFADSMSSKRNFPELMGSFEDEASSPTEQKQPEASAAPPLSSSLPTRADSMVSNTSSRSSHSHQSAPSSSSGSQRQPPRPRERQEIKGNGRTLGTLG